MSFETRNFEKVSFRFMNGSNLVELTDSNGIKKIVEIEEPEDFITNILELRAKRFLNLQNQKPNLIDRRSENFWKR